MRICSRHVDMPAPYPGKRLKQVMPVSLVAKTES